MRSPASPWWTRALTVLALCHLASSCEEPVELDIDIPRSRLVINSNFFPDELVTLRVSATRPIGTGKIPVIDAQVSLFEGTELAERLTFLSGKEAGEAGSYSTNRFRPRVGQKYTIHVSAAGYDPVTAVSSIPDPIAINSLSIHHLTTAQLLDETIYDYRLRIDYADPQDEINYYDLRIYQRVLPFKISAEGDTVRMNSYLKAVGTPDRLPEGASTVSVLLRDKGESGEVEVRVQSRLNSGRELLNGVVAELRTVSPEYYFYRRSLARDNSGAAGGLNEPIIIFDNVDSGLGIFAGYNSVKQDLDFTDR